MTDSKEVDFIFYSFVIDLINDKFYTKYNIKLSLAENEKDFNFNFSNLTKIDIKNYYNNLKLFLKRDCLQELYNEFIKENPTKNDNLTKENFLEENFKKKIIFEEKLRSDLSKSTGIKLNSQQEVFSNYLEQRNNFHLIEIIDIDGKEKYYAFEESIIPDTYPNIYEINQDIVNNTQDDNLKEKIKSCKKIENIDGLAPIFSLIEKTFINEVEKVHYREELLKMEKIDSLKKIMKNLPDTENIDHENAFLFDERYAAYLKNDGSIGIFDIFDNLFIPTTAISLEDNIYILKNIGRNLIQKNNVLLCSNIMSFDIAKKYFEEIETEIKKLEEINKSESCLLKNDNFSFSCSIDDINRIQCSITNDNKISFLIMKGKWGNEYLSDYPLSDFSTEENIQMLINFGKKIEEIDTDEMKRGEKIKIEEYKKKVIQEIRKKTLEMREKQGEIKVIDIKKVNVVNDNYQYHILECQKENERETSYLISETNFLTGNTTFSIIDKECYEYFYTIESDNINIFLTNIKNFDKKLYAANSKEVEKITKAISTFCDTQKTTNIEEDYFIKELREILTINEKYDYSFNTIDNPISLQIYKTISSQPNKTEYERDIMLSYNNLYERNLSLELFINGKGIFIDIEEFENNKNKGIHFYNDNINEEEYLSAINERLKNFINYLMEKHYQSSSNNNIKEANFLNELLATQYEYLDRLKNFQENIQQRIKVINEKESQPPLNPIESIIPITISEIPNKSPKFETEKYEEIKNSFKETRKILLSQMQKDKGQDEIEPQKYKELQTKYVKRLNELTKQKANKTRELIEIDREKTTTNIKSQILIKTKENIKQISLKNFGEEKELTELLEKDLKLSFKMGNQYIDLFKAIEIITKNKIELKDKKEAIYNFLDKCVKRFENREDTLSKNEKRFIKLFRKNVIHNSIKERKSEKIQEFGKELAGYFAKFIIDKKNEKLKTLTPPQ